VPARRSKSIDVNLLPKDPFAESPIGKFLTWALSIGRYIVVFTEMVVIITFLSRFTLDRKLTDLNNSILSNQALLQSYQQLETNVRTIQKKAEFLQTLDDKPQLIQVVNFVTENTPSDIVFEDISTRNDRFVMIAKAYSSQSLSAFVDTLKGEVIFDDVLLDKINTSDKDTGISFIVSAKYAGVSTPAPKPKTESSSEFEE